MVVCESSMGRIFMQVGLVCVTSSSARVCAYACKHTCIFKHILKNLFVRNCEHVRKMCLAFYVVSMLMYWTGRNKIHQRCQRDSYSSKKKNLLSSVKVVCVRETREKKKRCDGADVAAMKFAGKMLQTLFAHLILMRCGLG